MADPRCELCEAFADYMVQTQRTDGSERTAYACSEHEMDVRCVALRPTPKESDGQS